MISPIWITIALVSLLFSALFSGIEIAYVTSDRVRAELDVKRGGLISRALRRFYSRSEFFISTILVGNNIALVIYGMAAAAMLGPWLQKITHENEFLVLLFQTLISTGVILLCGEFLPKNIFRINPNASLRYFALPMYLLYIILYPISWFTTWLSKILMRLAGVKDTGNRSHGLSMGELNDYLERNLDTVAHSGDSETQHAEVEKEVKMFHNALDFSQTALRDCMTPRNEITAVDIDSTTRQQLVELFEASGRSKIIVYRDDIDNILGYIHVSELFHTDQDWRDHLKEVIFAPETVMANKMMRRLLSEKRSIAIVIDEYGGTAGMITLEDLVEEIFGDIRDEHDRDAPIARHLPDGSFEFSGRLEIEQINDQFGLDIPEDDDYQTLAGFILNHLGYIPRQGDTFVIDSFRFTIVKGTATRLELITMMPVPDTEADNSSSDNQ